MKLDPKENRFRRLAISVAGRLLACLVALSFLAFLVPVGTASAEKETLMACCVGKKAGHCESALSSKKSAPQHDHNTIVADEDETHSHDSSQRSAAESTAVRKPCNTDCCAATSTVRSQQKRERGTVQAKVVQHAPAAVLFVTDNTPSSVSTSDYLAQINPRGPPSSLL
jgi:hypothetical protein